LKNKKPRVGIFSLTSCAGCQLSILFLKDIALEVLDSMDVTYFPLVEENNMEDPFDIALVEGSVTRDDEVEKIKSIREKSKILIALGTCATYGGVPAIKDLGIFSEEDLRKLVYHDISSPHSMEDVYGINQYVPVDYYLRGCPVIKKEFVSFLKDLLLGKKPVHREQPVCIECRIKENHCLLQADELCMGSLTYGGCDALCPSVGIPCYGCRGPLPDANVDALANLLQEKGFTKKELRDRFTIFASTSKKLLKMRDVE
jgi:sulfhydrogenase subunit delta